MIDSHAHVMHPQFAEDRDEVVGRARAVGVRWLEIGTDTAGSQQAVRLAQEWPEDIVGATVGVHPSDIGELTVERWSVMEDLLKHQTVVAVGEVGLDYYRGGTREEQLPALERFVALAVTRKLPVVFHVRSGGATNAHADMLSFLGGLAPEQRPAGVMHTFSGTWDEAKEYLELGLHLSLSGVVTFKKAEAMQVVAREAPLERLLIETDCPFLTPEPYRGKRNEPAYVQYVAAKIAELRGVSLEEIATVTEQNARSLFAVKG